MHFSRCITIAALASAPWLAHAQGGHTTADPADASQPGQPIKYVSAFADYQPLHDEKVSPDANWAGANEAVADSDMTQMNHAMPMSQMDHAASAPPAKPAPIARGKKRTASAAKPAMQMDPGMQMDGMHHGNGEK